MSQKNGINDNKKDSANIADKPLIPSDKLYGGDQKLGPREIVNEDGEVIQIEYDSGAPVERGAWGGKFEFLLTAISYAVGLGNVWRFPYLCYRNGGGAFLIPYILMLGLVGLPIFFMEFAFGQFASLGPISVWSISPLFKGIGYGMVVVSWITSLYYIIIVTHCFYYLGSSFTSVLPWTSCNNTWNNATTCFEGIINSSAAGNSSSTITTPTEEFYENHVLQMSDGIEYMGLPSWKLTLILLVAWIIVVIVLLKGVETLGKAAYFTATFPYLILTILLIRGCLLPGSTDGLLFYLKPQWERLLDYRVWMDAATQIFYSLGVCNGGLITMSSYNNFKNNCRRDAILVAVLNCSTSIFAGLVIFSNLGFMAYIKATTVDKVAKEGPGLAFVVYPEALSNMPISPLWSVLFFIMMCTLGFGSEFSMMETVLSGLQDELRRIRVITENKHKIIFRVAVCVVSFLLGIPMLCPGGIYLLNLIDWSLSGLPLLFIAFCEVCVVAYLYGIKQFEKDIQLMIKEKPQLYWRATWFVISPFAIFVLIMAYFILPSTLTMDAYIYPDWARTMSTLIAMAPVVFIPLLFLYRYCKDGGWILFREYQKPKHDWGPAEEEHKQDFYRMLSTRKSKGDKADGKDETTENYDLDKAENFFQSKQSIVEKLGEAASKENLKKMTATGSFANFKDMAIKNPGILTSSQAELDIKSKVSDHPINITSSSPAMNQLPSGSAKQ